MQKNRLDKIRRWAATVSEALAANVRLYLLANKLYLML